jgi:hypothetical protein
MGRDIISKVRPGIALHSTRHSLVISSAHCDGSYVTPSNRERSFFTFHMYLNDDTSVDAVGPLEGGATTFHSMNMKAKMDVTPKVGRVLIFQHAYLLHSGEEVRKGLKLTMRTDLMYEKVSTESTAP